MGYQVPGCVCVGFTVGVNVKTKPLANATPMWDTEWLATDVDSARWSLFTLAIALVQFSNLAFNDGLMNLYLCFGVFDLYIINIYI